MKEVQISETFQNFLDGKLEKHLIKRIDYGSTYFYQGEYVKVLYFKKHKFRNVLSKYFYKENYQIKNLKKLLKLSQQLSINIYNITDIKSIQNNNFFYGIYSAEKVDGKIYHEMEKSLEVYKKAFLEYVKMLKNGIYEYDFGAKNFLVKPDGEIVFIDFDEVVVKSINKKYLYKSLALLKKNFKRECEEYGLDWDIYKKEALFILEKELGIKQEVLKKRIDILSKYRIIMKRIRRIKRIKRNLV